RRALSSGQIALFVITLTLLVFSSAYTNDYLLVHTCVIMVAVGGIRLRRLCDVYSLALLAMISVVLVLSTLGIIYNKDVIPNSRLVFSYGLGHPNGIGSLLFACCAALAYSCWYRRTWWVSLAVSAISSVFSYVFLSSHAAAAVLAALAIAVVVGHAMRRRGADLVPGKVFFATLTVLPFLMLLAMIVSTAFYSADNPVFALFNKLLHERPHFAHQYYSSHGGFTLFGAKYASVSNYHTGLPFTSVDCGYSRLALCVGAFAFVAMAATYVVAVRKLSRDNPHFLVMVILLLCSAYLMVETAQLYLASGVMAIFVSQAFCVTGDG
ncbi:MAG TPA: hypothetical protein DCP91_13730, partial [Eggerthellaceae bacterium]|nr:hypothetical protein [Eggerthellaceae bacterium]